MQIKKCRECSGEIRSVCKGFNHQPYLLTFYAKKEESPEQIGAFESEDKELVRYGKKGCVSPVAGAVEHGAAKEIDDLAP